MAGGAFYDDTRLLSDKTAGLRLESSMNGAVACTIRTCYSGFLSGS